MQLGGAKIPGLLSTPRAEAAAPPNPRPSYDQYMSFGLRGSLQTAQKYPLVTVLSRFGRIWGAFWTLRNETAGWGARPATVRRHFVGSERSMAFQRRLMTSPSISAIGRFVRGRYGDLQ